MTKDVKSGERVGDTRDDRWSCCCLVCFVAGVTEIHRKQLCSA